MDPKLLSTQPEFHGISYDSFPSEEISSEETANIQSNENENSNISTTGADKLLRSHQGLQALLSGSSGGASTPLANLAMLP